MTLTVLELRNYVIQPGQREHFIDYFEAHFIGSQQAVGMHVLGQFRVIGAPDRFVWLRAFADLPTRLAGLQAFYSSSAWLKYRPRTNEMIVDSDQVHLLRALGNAAALTHGRTAETVAAEQSDGTISPATGLIAVEFFHCAPALLDGAALKLADAYRAAGIKVRGIFAAEMAENDYPRLPIIQNPGELVIISAYPAEAAYHQAVASGLPAATSALLLTPTLRSPLRW